MSSLFEYCFSVLISEAESFMFIRALITYFFTVEWRVGPAYSYFKNLMLASRGVENLLNFIHTRIGCRVAMILWSPYFRAEIVKFQVVLF